MSAFRVSAAGLLRLASDGTLVDRVDEQVRMTRGYGAAPAERRSWERSLAVLAQDLADAGLHDVEVLIEYQLPLTSRRVDVILAGLHPRTGADSFVVVELKQWSRADPYEDSATLVDVPGSPRPRHLHPAVQVEDYCQYLIDFLGLFAESRNTVRGVAYLHNAADRDVAGLFDRPATEQSRLFTMDRRAAFLDHLRASLDGSQPGAGAADRFLHSAVRPSRRLLTYAAAELQDRTHFVLLDEQRIAYESVMHAVEAARAADSKRIVVVSGGPGSGKSVIALSLLGELARQGRAALHATGSRSFTQTLRRYAGKGSRRIQSMFLYFNSFMTAERNGIDVLICDEAHRIRETSVNRFTRAAQRQSARTQLEELVAAARVPVFLLDEHQVVKPGEQGNVEIIIAYARQRGLDVEVIPLHDQFRCGGSETYEQWVLDLLGLGGGKPAVWEGDGRFDLRVAGSPREMESFLATRQAAGETARITAGYCWPWSDPRPDGTLVDDVHIGDWARPWNVKSERSVGNAPGSAFWATDPNGFGQVGCVYTAQGFEYEWSGVILGPDLVARDGRLVTRRDECRDPAFRRTTPDAEADRLIRNTYKVLLTRGMRGTVVYSADPETRDFLTGLVHVRRKPETVYASADGTVP
ncbi:DUF2075 domain-containing protein [Actinoplanes sp. NPDC051851]|uniref:DUF2075 domain-containing protein n=1 Tax=Actinoplanes sp. NPDC051851 TaxID=3154753 RepID=UPI0034408813